MKNKDLKVYIHDLVMIDVTSSMGKLVLTIVTAIAEMQQEEILDKQKIGIEHAKAEQR